MNIGLDTMVVQDNEPLASIVDNEVVMLSIRAGAYFGLNGVGSDIWNMITSPRRVGEVCDMLVDDYEIPRDKLESEVIAFLESLCQQGLVRVIAREGTSA